MSRRKGKEDCSGAISAVSFGVFCVLGSLFLFYLISGPPTFLDVVTLSPGDTIFHVETFSRTWCQCVTFQSKNNVSKGEISLYRFGPNPHLDLSTTHQYDIVQNVSDPTKVFEYWEAYFHPGAVAQACFEFSHPINFYFSERYYVDGEERDADYQDHFFNATMNVTSGCFTTPPFNASGGWGFVFEKQFTQQAQTQGLVSYSFDMVEFTIPEEVSANASRVRRGEGEFCWETDAEKDSWLVAAEWEPPSGGPVTSATPRLEAHLFCRPRYALTIPITAIPVGIAVILEVLIIVFCICKPHYRNKAKYDRI